MLHRNRTYGFLMKGSPAGALEGWPLPGGEMSRAEAGGIPLTLWRKRQKRRPLGRLLATGQVWGTRLALALKPLSAAREERRSHRFLLEWVQVEAPGDQAVALLEAAIAFAREAADLSPRFRPEAPFPEELPPEPTLYRLGNGYLLAAQEVDGWASLAYAPALPRTLPRKPGAYPGHWLAWSMLFRRGEGREAWGDFEVEIKVEPLEGGEDGDPVRRVEVRPTRVLFEGKPLLPLPAKTRSLALPSGNRGFTRREFLAFLASADERLAEALREDRAEEVFLLALA